MTLPFLLAPQTHQICHVSGSPERQFCWTTSQRHPPPGQVNPIMYQAKSLQLAIHPLYDARFLGPFSHSGAGQSVQPTCRLEATVQIHTSSFFVSLAQITWSPRTPLQGKYSLPFPTHLCLPHRPRDASFSELGIQGEKSNRAKLG